jgi:hypothetical protein
MIEYPIKDRQILRLVEDDAIKTLIALEDIRLLLQNNELQTGENLFNSMKNYISALATRDINKVHYDNVRAAVKEIKEEIIATDTKNNTDLLTALDDSNVIDRLARALVDFCNALNIKIKKIEDSNFESDGMFVWDKTCLDLFGIHGEEGEKAKKALIPTSQSIFKKFLTQNTYSYNAWVNPDSTSESQFHLSGFLKIFISVIWDEKIKKQVSFAANNPAGTTTNVTSSLGHICNPLNKLTKTKKELQLHDTKHSILGSANIATFNDKMIKMLTSDEKNLLASITSWKLIYYLIKEVHNRHANGIVNPSELRFPGRGRELAQALGLKSDNNIPTINALILMFDSFKFVLPGITSSLISVAECQPNSKYSTKGGWIITVLPPLQPHYVHTDKGTFILPLIKKPPLVGHHKFYAHQCWLSWKIVEIFSDQSVSLAQYGWITITNEKWTQLFHELGIPERLFPKIHEAITGADGYLDHKGSDCYSLKNEEKPLKFLTEQGKIRIAGSNGGKIRAENKRKRITGKKGSKSRYKKT